MYMKHNHLRLEIRKPDPGTRYHTNSFTTAKTRLTERNLTSTYECYIVQAASTKGADQYSNVQVDQRLVVRM